MTASALEEAVHRRKAAGCDAHVTKPVRSRALKEPARSDSDTQLSQSEPTSIARDEEDSAPKPNPFFYGINGSASILSVGARVSLSSLNRHRQTGLASKNRGRDTAQGETGLSHFPATCGLAGAPDAVSLGSLFSTHA